MNEKLLQSLRHPTLTIGYADHNSHQPMPRAATVILDGSNTVVMGEAADEIERLTAENERLLAALEEICKVQNTYRSREQELAAMCLNQQSESGT